MGGVPPGEPGDADAASKVRLARAGGVHASSRPGVRLAVAAVSDSVHPALLGRHRGFRFRRATADRSSVVPDRRRQDRGLPRIAGLHDVASSTPRPRQRARGDGHHALHTAVADNPAIRARCTVDLRPRVTAASGPAARRPADRNRSLGGPRSDPEFARRGESLHRQASPGSAWRSPTRCSFNVVRGAQHRSSRGTCGLRSPPRGW